MKIVIETTGNGSPITMGVLLDAQQKLGMSDVQLIKSGAISNGPLYANRSNPAYVLPPARQAAAADLVAKALSVSGDAIIDPAPAVAAEPLAAESARVDIADDVDDEDDAAPGVRELGRYASKSVGELVVAIGELRPPEKRDARGKDRGLSAAEKTTALKALDAILYACAAAQADDGEVEVIVAEIVELLGVGKRAARALWSAQADRWARENAPNAAELAAKQTAEAAEAERMSLLERQAEIARLEKSLGALLHDPKLMERILLFFDEAGVVGERRACRAVFLTGVSRLTVSRALCLLRDGAPSSGKNHLADKVLAAFPPEVVVRLTGMSGKTLSYFGEGPDDHDALKHKILYVAEMAALATRGGEEHEATIALRSLIAEGSVQYATVSKDPETGVMRTVTMRKDGPTAFIGTSARDNIEAELKTRMLQVAADESTAQTRRVQSRIAAAAEGLRVDRGSKLTTEMLRDYQRLLQLHAPIDVVVPFARAILAAMADVEAPLRARRDFGNILAAVQASAMLYFYQRAKNADGALIATLDDYASAVEAFGAGMDTGLTPHADEKVVRLVAAVERLIHEATADERAAYDTYLDKAKASAAKTGRPVDLSNAPSVPTTARLGYRDIARQLGVASIATIGDRVRAAVDVGALEIVETDSFTRGGKQSPAYRVKIPAAELARQAAAAPGALPSRAAVEAMVADPTGMEAALDRLNDLAAAEDARVAARDKELRDAALARWARHAEDAEATLPSDPRIRADWRALALEYIERGLEQDASHLSTAEITAKVAALDERMPDVDKRHAERVAATSAQAQEWAEQIARLIKRDDRGEPVGTVAAERAALVDAWCTANGVANLIETPRKKLPALYALLRQLEPLD